MGVLGVRLHTHYPLRKAEVYVCIDVDIQSYAFNHEYRNQVDHMPEK